MNFYNFFLITERQGRISVANVFASDANQWEFELFAQFNGIVAILQFLHEFPQFWKFSAIQMKSKFRSF